MSVSRCTDEVYEENSGVANDIKILKIVGGENQKNERRVNLFRT
jgi:hypothetical protein